MTYPASLAIDEFLECVDEGRSNSGSVLKNILITQFQL